jgi:HK97 family phage prohead protease
MLSEIETAFPDAILRVKDEGDGRTIEGRIAPWDTPALVTKPVAGWESFKRGAFDKSLNESGRKIPMLLRHSEHEPAAVLVSHDNRDDGQHATFRALKTRAGDDALELIREGVYLGLSVGGWAVPARTEIHRQNGKQYIIRSEVKLDHVALLREPAYAGAEVLALRGVDLSEYDPVVAAEARKRMRQRLRLLNV